MLGVGMDHSTGMDRLVIHRIGAHATGETGGEAYKTQKKQKRI